MPATYDLTTTVGQARRMLGDTNLVSPLLSDDEIAANLSLYNNLFLAAAECAEDIAARMAQQVNVSVSGSSFSFDQRFQHYTALSKLLRARALRAGVSAFAGGISEFAKQVQITNPDNEEPFFTRDQYTVPASSTSVQ